MYIYDVFSVVIELEEKRLKERQELLSELEEIRQTAQVQISHQQTEYQHKLQDLASEMVYRVMFLHLW